MSEAGSDALDVSVIRDQATAIVAAVGELDLATTPILDAVLHDLEAPCERVVLDLSRLTFIDSTGLRLVLTAHRHAMSDGFDLVVAGAGGHVLEILRLTALDVTLPMASDVPSVLGDGTHAQAWDEMALETQAPDPQRLSEERELFERLADERDPVDRERLVERFLPLAQSFALTTRSIGVILALGPSGVRWTGGL